MTQPDPEPVPMERIIVEAASYGHLFGPDPSRWPPFALRAIDGWVALYETSTHRKGDGLMATRETPTHSPAPWTRDGRSINDAGGQCVLRVQTGFEHDTVGEANARLALKSPELLTACRAMVHDAEETGHAVIIAGDARHAVMKALVDHIDGGGE